MATTPYTVTLTDGTIFANIATGTINTASSVTLIGKNYADYGQMLADNFIRMLENASNTTAPPAPITGQLWWDKTNTLLKVYSSVAGWKVVGGATASGSQPSPSVVGDLWYDTASQQLKICSVAGNPGTFIVVGANINNSGNITFAVAGNTIETVASTGVTVTGILSASGNVTGSNVATTGVVTATGNITAGNILTGGLVSATGTVTGSSLLGTVVSASGNVTSGNILTGGLVSAAGTVTGSSLLGTVVSASGNVTGGNILTGGLVSAGGNVTGSSLLGSVVSVSGNVTGGNMLTGGRISAAGNITGSFFIGDGSQLTGLASGSISNGTSNVRVVSSGGNVAIGVGGTSNIAVYANTGTYFTGVISANGNVTGGNMLTGGLVSAAGTVTGSSLLGSVVSVSGTITGSQFTGSGSGLTSIPGGNVSGTVANATYATSAAAATSATTATTAGTVTNATQGNITSVGTLTGLTLGGTLLINNAVSPNTNTIQFGDNTGWTLRYMTNVSGTPTQRFSFTDQGAFSATGTITGSTFYGSGAGLTNIPGGNVSKVANATYADSAGTATSATSATTATTAGTVTNGTQGNITGVGTLTSLSVSGNITSGNLFIGTGTTNVASLIVGSISSRAQATQITSGIIDPNYGVGQGPGGFRTGVWQLGGYNDNKLYFVDYSDVFSPVTSVFSQESYVPTFQTGKVYATSGFIAGNPNLTPTANISGGNLIVTTAVSAGGNISASGNIFAGSATNNRISAGGNITSGGNISAVGDISGQTAFITGNLRGGNISAPGNVTIGGGVNGAGPGQIYSFGINNTYWGWSSIATNGGYTSIGPSFGSPRVLVFTGTGGTVTMPQTSLSTVVPEYFLINRTSGSLSIVDQFGFAIISVPSGTTCTMTARAVSTYGGSTWQASISSPILGLACDSNQSWQDVSASRALNTNYTNSTGRPIMVNVSVYTNVNQQMTLVVGGVTVAYTGWSSFGAGAVGGMVSAVVPPTVVYQAYSATGVGSALTWSELR